MSVQPSSRELTSSGSLLEIDELILELLPAAAYVCADDGTIVRYNRKAAELWGRSPQPGDTNERFCGSHRLFRPNGQHLRHEECPMEEVLRTGIPARDREVIIEQPSGARLWALVNIEPIRTRSGEISGAINCFQDISGRKTLELELRQRQEELEDFFENGAVALHLVAGDGTILRANKAELDLLGYTAEEYIGRRITEFHADQNIINDILRRLLGGEKIDQFPARLRAKDGSTKYVLITSSGHFRDGAFVNTRCFTVDVTEQHLTDEALREHQQRLATTYQAVPVGIAEVDEHGRFLRVNEAMCSMTGLTCDELTHRKFSDITHPEDRQADIDHYARLVRGESDRYALQKRFIRKDGSIVYVHVIGSSVCDAQGRFCYGIRVVQDVTERQRMQTALAERERRTRDLLEALPVAIYTTDVDGRITYFNGAAAEFAGRKPEPGQKWCVTWRLYRPDGTPLPHNECPLAMTLKENRPVRGFEALAERPDGTRIPFLPYPTPLYDASGALAGAVNVLVDIAEHKRAEEATQRLASIVESSSDAIVSKDLHGIIKTWNKGAERLFGYTSAEIVGKPITILIPPDRQDEERAILDRIRCGERVADYETIRTRKDGTSVDVSLTISPVKGADGTIVGASKIARDISERKRAEKRQELLIHELNHRVKNTLATVQSIAAQTFRGDAENAFYPQFEARLMALARAHDVLTRDNWESARIRDIVADTTAPHCGDASRFATGGPDVRLMPNKALSLAMVLHELCTNASKYGALSNAAGRVTIQWHLLRDELGQELLKLRWQEHDGPPVVPPTKKGFGSRLIERVLTQDLDAVVCLDYPPTGVVLLIEAPLR